jgi:hypothetical protein
MTSGWVFCNLAAISAASNSARCKLQHSSSNRIDSKTRSVCTHVQLFFIYFFFALCVWGARVKLIGKGISVQRVRVEATSTPTTL